ncbi:hypothetical protein DFAR_660016 [Desulfarculales bacterium]
MLAHRLSKNAVQPRKAMPCGNPYFLPSLEGAPSEPSEVLEQTQVARGGSMARMRHCRPII